MLDSLGIPDFNPNKNFGGDGDGENNVATNPDTFIINPAPYFPEVVVPSPVFPNLDDGNRYIGPNNPQEAIKKAFVDPMSLEGVAPTESPVLSAPKSIDAVGVAPVVSAGGAGPELLTDVPDIFGQNPISLLSPIAPSLISLSERRTPGGGIVPREPSDFNAFYVPPKVSGAVSSPDFAKPELLNENQTEAFFKRDTRRPDVLNAAQVVGLNPRIDANGNILPGRADTAADIEAGTLASRNFGPEVMSSSPIGAGIDYGNLGNIYNNIPKTGNTIFTDSPVAGTNRFESVLPYVGNTGEMPGSTPSVSNTTPPEPTTVPRKVVSFEGELINIPEDKYNPTSSLGLDPAPNMALPDGSAIPGGIQPNSGPVFTGPDGTVLTPEVSAAINAQARLDAGPANRVRGLATGLDTMALEEAAYPPAFSDDMRQVIVDNMQPLQATAEALKRAELDVSALDRIAEARMPTDDMQIVDDMRSVPRSSPEFASPVGDLAQFEPKVIAAPVQTAPAVSPEVVARSVEKLNPGASDGEIANIKSQLDESVPVQGFGKFIANVGQSVFLGLGSEFVQGLVNKTEAQRTNIVAQHMSAINEGATPKYDDEGKYIGYDTSTMGTFADKVLAGDAREFLPPTLPDLNYTVTQDDLDSLAATNKLYKDSNISTLKGKDLDGDGLPDTRTNLVSPVYGDGLNLGDQINMSGINSPSANEYASGFTDAEGNPVTDNSRFQQIYNVQSEAAEIDPNGSSTENGFITSDGREFVVTYDGKLLEVNDGVVGTGAGIFNNGLGTGTNVSNVYNILDDDDEDEGDGDDSIVSEIDTGYTIDESGNRICNEAGYVYDVASDACIIAEELSGNGNASLNIGSGGSGNVRSFNDVLRSIETRPAKIAPISANIKPMAQGGMAGLNRAADNFLRALGG